MKSTFYLLKDQRIYIDDVAHTVVRTDHASETLVESEATGMRSPYSAFQLVQMYLEGRLQTGTKVRSAKAPVGRKNRPPARMDAMSPVAKHETMRKLDLLVRMDNADAFSKSRAEQVTLLRDICKSRGEAYPPHISTVFRWRRSYRKAQSDVRALFSQIDQRGGRGGSRLGADVEQALDEAINDLVLSRKRFSPQEILEAVTLRVATLNGNRGANQQLKSPSLRTIHRRLANEAYYDLLVARVGLDEAGRRFSVGGASRKVNRILEMVEIDHSPVDLLVVGDDGQVVGRPTITAIIDRKSRCILGYCLSLAGHGVPTVFAALRHALLPKQYLAQRYADLNLEWPMYGWFERVVKDNGPEFHAEAIVHALLNLGIAVEFSASRQPNDKPHIERFFKTFNYGFIHTLKGTTLAKVHERIGFKSEDEAVMTLAQLDRVIHVWICDVYHRRPHRGLGGKSPWEAWFADVGAFPPLLKMNVEDIDHEFAEVDTCVMHHYGIERNTFIYNSPVLQDLRKALPMRAEVHIKWPRWDVGHIFVWNSVGQEYIKVPNIREDLAGLTLDQAKAVKTAEGATDPSQRIIAGNGGQTIRRLEQEAATDTALKNRRKAGRLGHHTSDKTRAVEAVVGEAVTVEQDDEVLPLPGHTDIVDIEMEVMP